MNQTLQGSKKKVVISEIVYRDYKDIYCRRKMGEVREKERSRKVTGPKKELKVRKREKRKGRESVVQGV